VKNVIRMSKLSDRTRFIGMRTEAAAGRQGVSNPRLMSGDGIHN